MVKAAMLANESCRWMIVSYQTFLSLAGFMANRSEPDIVILDESHYIKNPKAKITNVVHTYLRHAKNRLILTGTPFGQSKLDIWAQIYFLDHGKHLGTSFYKFQRTHFQPDYMGWNWTMKSSSLTYLNALLNEMGVVMREEELDLPPATYNKLYAEPTPWQKRLLGTLEEEFQASTKDGELVVDTQWAMTKVMKMRQVCSGFIITDDKRIISGTSDKYTILMEQLRTLLPDYKVVVWCSFRYEIRRIHEMLEKAAIGHVLYIGGMNKRTRTEVVDSFQTSKRIRVFVGQIRAGGISITLTEAAYAFYFSNEYSVISRQQSERRTRRIGSEKHKSIHYTDIMTRGSVEESVVSGLLSKGIANEVALFKHILKQLLGKPGS